MQKQGQNALVFGATGAIGAELVALLLKSNKWKKVHCVVRRELEEWKNIIGKEKLVIERCEDLDQYFKQTNDKYTHINSIFSCFGTQVKYGEQTFRKVDKTYPLLAADIALKNNIPHYLLVSSASSNQTSCLLYLRVKGQLQTEIKLKKIPILSIFKPGLLKNRRDARFGQKLGACLPCFPGIDATDACRVLTIIAEKTYENNNKQQSIIIVYENTDMLQIVENKTK